MTSRFTEPCFLSRQLRKELGSGYKPLVIAVHAVLIESGFIGLDPVSGTQVDGFPLPEEQASGNLAVSHRYTLPQLLGNGNVAETIVLEFGSSGRCVFVYGSLADGGSERYGVVLDMYKFLPTICFVWANGKNDGMNENDRSSLSDPQNEIFEFWKIVKDGIALPLLINLCEKAGLELPPCLMRLSPELKLKILESLPAIEIPKMECVCSEMRRLSSNNDVLWKQKCVEDFGDWTAARGTANWKERFASCWKNCNKSAYMKKHNLPNDRDELKEKC